MQMLNIEMNEEPVPVKAPFLHLGFRPFFMAGIIGGIIMVALWMGMYVMRWQMLPTEYPSITWHAHEMIYGYSSAVVIGFLLTAVKNWTGIQTIHHTPLLVLFGLWMSARVLAFIPGSLAFTSMAVLDCLFFLFALIAYSHPVFKTRQWNQLTFSGKLLFLLASNILFYLGLSGALDGSFNAVHYGLYIGLYTIIATIFTMGRRIIPFFIAKGLDVPFEPTNYRWLDLSSLWFFLAFSISDIVSSSSLVTTLLAITLLVIHSIRLKGWYHHGIWKKPLLWVLFVGYLWLVFGFVLKILSGFFGISPFLAIHAFAYGGVAIITLGMMARVILGHTGRNVFDPPPILVPVFILLFVGTVVRVIFPLLFSAYYVYWVGLSQILWIAAYSLLALTYVPMLAKARIDGRYG